MSQRIEFKLDLNKMKRDINRELVRFGKQGVDGFTNADKKSIGDDVIDAMKDSILKGVSPIQGWGRFPAYKWVGRAQSILKSFNRQAKASSSKSVSRSVRAAGRKKARAAKALKYPASAQREFPGKRERPVNLFLSGDFLDAIQAKARPAGIFIGFFIEKFAKYEEGHRTGGVKGVNDQPKRPIIPNSNETFTRSIYQRLVDSVRYRLMKKLEGQSRNL